MGKKENKSLIKINNIKDIIAFLKQPAVKMAKALPGILASGRTDLVLSAGRLVQASFEYSLLKQLGQELNHYVEKGKIKKNYFATNKNQVSLYELLKFIDKEIPDEERFKAMKSIFLSSVSKNSSREDEELAYELMQICKKLSSGEILILKAVYNMVNERLRENTEKPDLNATRASFWFTAVASQVGHNMPKLVERYELNLMDLKLITERNQPHNFSTPQDTFKKSDYFRLTPLGYKLCEFITRYK